MRPEPLTGALSPPPPRAILSASRLSDVPHRDQPTGRPESPTIPLRGCSVPLGPFGGGRSALNKGTLEILLYLENRWFTFQAVFLLQHV